ncbi:cytochrome P450 [Kutzneria sp. NPDC052558]|uniref:cytochrome P450 n=1 Tax=Kutzneria sp. NPDC052558 TaxID=3364121 RepID=UPI0037CA0351
MADTSSVSPSRAFPMERPAGCPFDPPAEYAEFRARETLPVLECPAGIDAYVASGYDQVRALLNDPRTSTRGAPSNHVIRDRAVVVDAMPGSIIHFDGAEHVRYRRMLTPEFTVKRMRALRGRIGELVESHIDAMLAKGGPVDFVRDFALPLPSLVICELLGADQEDRARFQEQATVMISTDGDPDLFMATVQEVLEYITGLVTARMERPRDDMLSRMIQRGRDSKQPPTVLELANLGLFLLMAGHESTANMIGLGALAMLRHPEQLALLRADPALAESAVEETLRYLSIVHYGLLRYATEDIVHGSQTIRAGEWLVASLASANRDGSVFADPDTFDLRRAPTKHLAFGFGSHQCIGQQLARVELREVFSRLFGRIPSLRLAVPFEELEFKASTLAYGVAALPVTWDT